MPQVAVKIIDETPGGEILKEIKLSFLLGDEVLKVRDILKARVYKEVEVYNKKLPEYFNGLVQPTDAEKTLNGYKMRIRKLINPEEQYQSALNAFKQNVFFILVDHKQVESLDEEVVIDKFSTVSFVKLTPLIGG